MGIVQEGIIKSMLGGHELTLRSESSAATCADPTNSTGDQLRALASMWDVLGEGDFHFAKAALGNDLADWTWPQYSAWLLRNSLAEWRDQSSTDSMKLRWGSRNPVLAEPEIAQRTAHRMLRAWQLNPDASRLHHAVGWAVKLGAWDDLAALWLEHLHCTRLGIYPGVLDAFAELPPVARRAAPLLSWAAALARAEAAREATRDDTLVRCVVADANSLHADWRNAERTDSGVAAGMLVMLAQRAMPTSPVAQALDEAWETQTAVAAYIHDRRTEGRPPSSRVEALFRATSAQVALARADLPNAVAEAEFAIAIDPWVGNSTAGGTRDLALELSGRGSSAPRFVIDPIREVNWLHRDPVTTDVISARLATAITALRKLDRVGCARALSDLESADLGPAHWTTALYVESLSAALWGDPTAALARLDSVKLRRGPAAVEQYERLGAGLLLRARITLLDHVGAYAAAKESARGLPPSWRWVMRAYSLLWAGEADEALRVAESGIYDPGTPLADRLSLRIVRVAAIALQEPAADPERVRIALDSVAECIGQHFVLPLGLLPARAREALLAWCPGPQKVQDTPCWYLSERVGALTPSGQDACGRVQLTRRERVLMPLLASADSVPDIARTLQVSPNTVRKQVVTLRAKFAARTRAELVRKVRDAGLMG